MVTTADVSRGDTLSIGHGDDHRSWDLSGYSDEQRAEVLEMVRHAYECGVRAGKREVG